ncbi:uncharacterized protein LOC117116501 [Anneissia japonica]|uniref:uncharacterized protein LOC117116501 n=1 Tax=Anneissia japonica TaxID=1529436 RepID=UPI001425A537|nr:uncharacterized protein LOC117116501 [Anneissia japonica]
MNTPIPASPEKREALFSGVNDLLLKGAVVEVFPTTEDKGFISTLFLTEKSSGGWRLILNLRRLNQWIRPQKFGMDTLVLILQGLMPRDWAATIDLKDAYFHVPIFWTVVRISSKFFPLVYPRLLRVVKSLGAVFHARGIRIFMYLDDWLVVANSRATLLHHLSIVLDMTETVGFIINREKSVLVPTQLPLYLGAHIDLVHSVAFPSTGRIRKCQLAITQLLSLPHSPAESWLRMLGFLASLVDLVPYCQLLMRPLQLHLLAFFSPASRDLSAQIPLNAFVARHLRWWLQENVLQGGKSFPDPLPVFRFSADASLEGWGSCSLTERITGDWSLEESTSHINVLELLAVRRSLEAFVDRAKGKAVLVHSDSSTVVSYINRQGGTHSPTLCFHTWQLLLWCLSHRIHLRAAHIPGRLNVLADGLSRRRLPPLRPTEWRLCPVVAQHIFNTFGRPNLDLFATSSNTQLPTFCSRFPEPTAWAVDALSISWDGFWAYAFPPLSLLPRVMGHIRRHQCKAFLIAPWWAHQGWFLLLLSLLFEHPRVLLVLPDLLQQARSWVGLNHLTSLNLTVWPLSGIISESGVDSRDLQQSP